MNLSTATATLRRLTIPAAFLLTLAAFAPLLWTAATAQAQGGDTLPPSVSFISIASDPDDNIPQPATDRMRHGLYAIGDAVRLTVLFDKPVAVTGTPQLRVTVGNSVKTAAYKSVEQGAVTFEYVVAQGDEDEDGIAVAANALALNGGAIRDAANNDANLSHAALPDHKNHKVDGVRPRIDEIGFTSRCSQFDPESSYFCTAGESLSIGVEFTEPVYLNAAGQAQMPFDLGGAAKAAEKTVRWQDNTKETFQYLIRDGDSDLDGPSFAANALTLKGAAVQDAAGNDAVLTHPAGAAPEYRVDAARPAVSSIAITSDPGDDDTYSTGDAVEVAVAFSENVTVPKVARRDIPDDELRGVYHYPQLELNVGGQAKTARFQSFAGNRAFFQYTVQAGDADADGIAIGADQLALSGGTILDDAGNNPVSGIEYVLRMPLDYVVPHTALSDDAGHKVAGAAAPLTLQGPAILSYQEDGERTPDLKVLSHYRASGTNAAVNWSLSGYDARLFRLYARADGARELRFIALPDYENPVDWDRDNKYRITVQASDGANAAALQVTVLVHNVAFDDGEVPGIVGTAQAGRTLTIDTSRMTMSEVALGPWYQWIRSDGTTDTEIPGARYDSYTLTDDDIGKTVKARVELVPSLSVSTTDPVGWVSRASEPTATVAAAPVGAAVNSPATGAPVISGAPVVGQTLTADVSGIADADGLTNATYSYQWIYNDGAADVEIASGLRYFHYAETPAGLRQSYTLPEGALGWTYRVRVSFIDDAGSRETLTSSPTAPVAAPVPPAAPPTPTPPPTPAPPAAPAPEPNDICLSAIDGDAEGDATIKGSWDWTGASTNGEDDHCSSGQAPPGGVPAYRHARYYTFTLQETANVKITLASETDTYLYLLSGVGKYGEVLHEHDEISYHTDSSRLDVQLEAGPYTIEATTFAPYYKGEFTLLVAGLPAGNGAGATDYSCLYGFQGDAEGKVTIRGAWHDHRTSLWKDHCSTYRPTSSDLSDLRPEVAGLPLYRHARYYTFTLQEAANVSITLASRKITHLYLLSGVGKSGEVLGQHNEVSHDTDGSRLDVQLGAGAYTIMATTLHPFGVSGEFTISVAGLPAGTGDWTIPIDPTTLEPAAAPTLVAEQPLADIFGLQAGGTQDVSLSGVFSDSDGDALTITAASSDETKVTVSVAADYSNLTLAGVSEGTATVTVTAQDADGNRVNDNFDATVGRKYAALIAQIYQMRNDPQLVNYKEHTDPWDRVLLALGETVADATLTPMAADEAAQMAQAFRDRGWKDGWTFWAEVTAALRDLEAAGQAGQQQQQQAAPNRAPTVSAALADATIVNASGTRQVSLTGVFSDADYDNLTITAASSDETKATVSVASDYSSLTVSAQARGTATITVTADDGRGGTVGDTFTVTVKAAPVVALNLNGVSGVEVGATQDVSLSSVFSDADGDALTITASSDDETVATVTTATDGSSLAVAGVSAGEATITVTAQDADGNTVSDDFTVTVAAPQQQGSQQQESAQPLMERCAAHLPANAISVAEVTGWRNAHSHDASHVLRWNRVLEALGEDTGTGAAPLTVAESKANELRFMRTRWSRVTATLEGIASCVAAQQQPAPDNNAPTVSSAIADATIVSESGTHQVSLSSVFSDADNDGLTITAASSDEDVATVSVAADQSSLTVSAQARGTATITVTASDGNGGTVADTFTVTVKAAPTVAAAIADATGLEVDATQEVSLSGVFSDADGDSLTITAASSDETKATVTVAADQSKLTLTGVAVGTATITVTARDADGNTVSDAFDAPVAKKYAALIAQMYQWRNGPEAQQYGRPHTFRWDRALLAMGETVSDASVTPMTAAEAQALADQDWGARWIPVAAALREIEAG